MWQVLEENIAMFSLDLGYTLIDSKRGKLKDSGRTVLCFVERDKVIQILSTKEQTAKQLNKLENSHDHLRMIVSLANCPIFRENSIRS